MVKIQTPHMPNSPVDPNKLQNVAEYYLSTYFRRSADLHPGGASVQQPPKLMDGERGVGWWFGGHAELTVLIEGKLRNSIKVPCVARHEGEAMLNRCSTNQQIRNQETFLT